MSYSEKGYDAYGCRDDVEWFCVGGMMMARVGEDGVTAIKISNRNGEMASIPCIEVWKGDHLHAEVYQSQCSWVQFKAPHP